MKRAFVLFLIMAALWGCDRKDSLLNPQVAELHGQLTGYVRIPRNQWPVDQRPEVLGYLGEQKLPVGSTWVTLSSDSQTYEIRRSLPTDSLELRIGGQMADLNQDGSFVARNVPTGIQTVEFIYAGQVMGTQSVEIAQSQHELQLEIQRVVGTCCEAKAMNPSGDQATNGIPCLDNNGFGPGGFVYSDCYVSLFYGPPWYNWMCWSEAMNVTHDHHGNIWCNGSHNCSLWVHGWDWNKQYWHKHSWPWLARW